jgi:hypothetical protein
MVLGETAGQTAFWPSSFLEWGFSPGFNFPGRQRFTPGG